MRYAEIDFLDGYTSKKKKGGGDGQVLEMENDGDVEMIAGGLSS